MSGHINKDWMNESDRGGHLYVKGVDDFLEFASKNNFTQLPTIPCPCVKYRNKMRHILLDVRKHLVRCGIDTSYTLWALHGEKPSMVSIPDSTVKQANQQDVDEDISVGGGMENLVDATYGLHEMYDLDGDIGQTRI